MEKCKHCGSKVVEIEGEAVTRGRLPTHRHARILPGERKMLYCPKGDPLFPEDVV